MKKSERLENNSIIEKEWNIAYNDFQSNAIIASRKLRSCSAVVHETDNYYFLQSYNTIVAFIDKYTDTCYDVLRLVYGYTATSAQHIAKFRHDYGRVNGVVQMKCVGTIKGVERLNRWFDSTCYH